MTARPVVDDAARRTRLLRRHGLDGVRGPAGPEQVTADAVGLHATIPASVSMAAWARGGADRPEALEQALSEQRTLIKQLAMRRTLFVLDRPLLAAAVGTVGGRVAASERTNLLRDLRRDEQSSIDPETWIDEAAAAVTALLADRELTSTQVREALPEFDRSVEIAPGKRYGGPSPLLPRVLNMLAARGAVVRGPNAGRWHQSRYSWTAMETWLGGPLQPLDPAAGHRLLIEAWLRSYGPGTEDDLVWWLGSMKTAVRSALRELDVVEVELDGGVAGLLMADDLETVPATDPVALLLPSLDPATMGYKHRDFYLGPHAAEIFDRSGNGGQTAWWDGRIVGSWLHRPEQHRVEVIALEDLPAPASRALDERAAELAEWLGGDSPAVGFPSPVMRRHR